MKLLSFCLELDPLAACSWSPRNFKSRLKLKKETCFLLNIFLVHFCNIPWFVLTCCYKVPYKFFFAVKVCVCARAWTCVCVHVYVFTCMCLCVCECVHVTVHVCVQTWSLTYTKHMLCHQPITYSENLKFYSYSVHKDCFCEHNIGKNIEDSTAFSFTIGVYSHV